MTSDVKYAIRILRAYGWKVTRRQTKDVDELLYTSNPLIDFAPGIEQMIDVLSEWYDETE